jgi:hypothetical protein
MTRMNWDRVRKEHQAQRSGSEWFGQDGLLSETSLSALQARSGDVPGCTCNKKVGFIGQHKKYCLLRKRLKPTASIRGRIVPTAPINYPQQIKDQLAALSDFFSSLEVLLKSGRGNAEVHRDNIRRLIKVLQAGLEA